jgi:xylulokinase
MTNTLGIPLYTVNTVQGAAFGAAILAGVGDEAWPDVPTACRELVKKSEALAPDPHDVEIYQGLYRLFRNLYPALRELNTTLVQFG